MSPTLYRLRLVGQSNIEFILPLPMPREDGNRSVEFFRSVGVQADLIPVTDG